MTKRQRWTYGETHNELAYISAALPHNGRNGYGWFKCSCGNEKLLRCDQVRSNQVFSCGCVNRFGLGAKKHGLTNTTEYTIWEGIIQRCGNPKNKAYNNYGGRGIKVCDRWLEFENFLADMGNRPEGDYQLDRKENNGPYSPENCRWVTRKENNRNKRNNKWVVVGTTRMILSDYANSIKRNPKIVAYWYKHNKLPEGVTKG